LKLARFVAVALVVFSTVYSSSEAQASLALGYPTTPHEELTPGALCERPSQKRYPEGIPYCSRDVEPSTKRAVMEEYDRTLGYRTTQMERSQFKIDHFIPLCMGGSNREENLWPQHRTVYEQTDPLEGLACEKMAQGRLLQKDAVAMIREAKYDLKKAPVILRRLQSL
jgi:hypothetical protein